MEMYELLKWFDSFKEYDILTTYSLLKQKNNIKKYKKTLFYKQTKMNIIKAYSLYTLNGLYGLLNICNSELVTQLRKGNYNYLIILIENLIENFDITKLDNILDYITNKFNNINFNEVENKIQNALKEFKVISKNIR